MNKLGILNKTVVPINLKPDFQSEMADEGIYGMVVKILEELEDNWYLVETSYDYRGYIHGSNMIIDTDRAVKWDEEAVNIISHNIVDIMPRASYKGNVVDILTRGAVVILTGKEEDNWSEIKLADDSKGWVRTAYIGGRIRNYNIEEEEKLREAFVNTAMHYMGTQYRWGGKTPLGLDCSGLCSISYLMNGIKIYRDAELRGDNMKKISLEDIKKGDLIFFPGHVAMYIGDNKYIHSSQSINGVGINSLDPKDKDYLEKYSKTITEVGSIF